MRGTCSLAFNTPSSIEIVDVSGVPYPHFVNGRYDYKGNDLNGVALFKKRGKYNIGGWDTTIWLYRAHDGCWMVGTEQNKDNRALRALSFMRFDNQNSATYSIYHEPQ